MFVKRKKFKEPPTAANRLLDRWEQQVFFIMQKFPHAAAAVATIRENHAAKTGGAFMPSEESLADLADLQLTLLGDVGANASCVAAMDTQALARKSVDGHG